MVSYDFEIRGLNEVQKNYCKADLELFKWDKQLELTDELRKYSKDRNVAMRIFNGVIRKLPHGTAAVSFDAFIASLETAALVPVVSYEYEDKGESVRFTITLAKYYFDLLGMVMPNFMANTILKSTGFSPKQMGDKIYKNVKELYGLKDTQITYVYHA